MIYVAFRTKVSNKMYNPTDVDAKFAPSNDIMIHGIILNAKVFLFGNQNLCNIVSFQYLIVPADFKVSDAHVMITDNAI